MGFLESLKKFFLDFDNKESFDPAQDFTVLVVGLVLVIAALFLLSLLITLFSHIFKERKVTNNNIKEIENSADNTDNAVSLPSGGTAADESELIAVLTAAIANYSSQTNCNLKVTSFRRINNTSPAWNTAGRRDNINSSL